MNQTTKETRRRSYDAVLPKRAARCRLILETLGNRELTASEIKPRVMLRPFRTFLEVEQPESEFLLRVDPDEGIGFFEADGGIWKLEAKKNIADYFLKNMGDLIDAGKVVVMQ